MTGHDITIRDCELNIIRNIKELQRETTTQQTAAVNIRYATRSVVVAP